MAACTLSVLAYDGVWLTAPRTQASLLLPPGGRAEVLVGCARGGVFAFGSLGSSDYGGVLTKGTVAVLDVAYAAPAYMPPVDKLQATIFMPSTSSLSARAAGWRWHSRRSQQRLRPCGSRWGRSLER